MFWPIRYSTVISTSISTIRALLTLPTRLASGSGDDSMTIGDVSPSLTRLVCWLRSIAAERIGTICTWISTSTSISEYINLQVVVRGCIVVRVKKVKKGGRILSKNALNLILVTISLLYNIHFNLTFDIFPLTFLLPFPQQQHFKDSINPRYCMSLAFFFRTNHCTNQ